MLVGLCGSLRAASTNRKLLQEAARIYGGPYKEGNLRLPLYDGDLEKAQGLPAEVEELADLISQAEAVFLATPEYNQSLSGVMKNALDWVSRTDGAPWHGKPVALLSAAAGRSGGARGSYALRLAITPFRPRLVSAPDVLLAQASSQFDEAGHLTDDRAQQTLREVVEALKAEVAREP
ncbi:MAG: NAD(P)H-dependent oxidoreductase [Pseudomonadota bacterium]